MGGISSCIFYNWLWFDVLKGVCKGDWVIIELGYNDNGLYDSGCVCVFILGIGKDSLNVIIKEIGVKEIVYMYGEYMCCFIYDVKKKGVYFILMFLIFCNVWEDVDSIIIIWVN